MRSRLLHTSKFTSCQTYKHTSINMLTACGGHFILTLPHPKLYVIVSVPSEEILKLWKG